MAIAYLMRHGAVDNPNNVFYPPDTPLSELGKRQVLATAERIKIAGLAPVKLVASPYLRTRQSAEIVAQCLAGMQSSFDDRLREWSVESWFGKPFEEFYQHVGWVNGFIATDFPPDIEPYPQLAARVAASIREALAAADGKDVLLISHGEPIAAAAVFLQGRPWLDVRTRQVHLAEVWAFSFDDSMEQCSVTQVFDTPAV